MNTVKFCERLKDLRTDKQLSQIELSKRINVGKSIISAWEIGKSEPTMSNLVSLAKFFDVSLDYLVGLTDFE